ncbi:conserved hypothetical protein [Rubrivivax sp. A210]|uniref:hypothetical protein n=1 Tax=Rubrivivax sp. A210 TaxID=2772301 RepID=UPI0019181DF5|nr:hypothetical protein [Rubrivivax sp. A210]CAD5374675.1 conserved hypothetical protein [Rubrivivax sp. A210]
MLTVTEPALLIRIAKLHRPGMTPQQLYEATRGVWKLGPDKDSAEYALSIAGGVVQEVYTVATWHGAGTTPYTTRPLTQVAVPNRWEFSGKVAPAAIRDKYVGKNIAHYFAKGNASPVNYVNIKHA